METTTIEEVEIFLPEKEFIALEKKSCCESIVSKEKVTASLILNETEYVITGFSSSGTAGYIRFSGYAIVDIENYSMEIEPLPYSKHFAEVDKGNRDRSYVGMKCTYGKRTIVFIQRVDFLKEKKKPLENTKPSTKEISEADLDGYTKFISAMADYAESEAREVGIKNFDYLRISVDCGSNTFLGVVSVKLWHDGNLLVILALGDHFHHGKKRNFEKKASPKFGPYAQAWYSLADFYSDIDSGKVRFLNEAGEYVSSPLTIEENTKPSTPADGMQSIFAWKEKKFSIQVSIGESEGKFCIQWHWSLQQKEGGSKGDSHSSGFVYESKVSAVRDVIGKVNMSIVKRVKDFSHYHWASHFLKKVREAEVSNTETSTEISSKQKIYRWNEDVCSNPAIFIIYNADNVALTVGIAYNNSEKAWFVGSHQKFIDSQQIRKLEVAVNKVGGYETFEDAVYSEVQSLLEWTVWQVDNKELPKDIFERVRDQCSRLLEANLQDETALENFLKANEFFKEVKEVEHTEPAPIIKKVDGLDQIQLFEVEEQKKARNPDAELFGYVAKDKIDRQRFKRKISLLIDKLKELPPVERNALVRAVNSKFTPPHF